MPTIAYATYIDLLLNMLVKVSIIAVAFKVIQFINLYINKNMTK